MNRIQDRLRTVAVLVLLTVMGFLAADTVAAIIERQTFVAPKAYTRTEITVTTQPQKTAEEYVAKLQNILPAPSAPASPGTVTPPGLTGTNPTNTTAGPVNEWDQLLQNPQQSMKLLGTMRGASLKLAMLEVRGEVVPVELGQSLGSWVVQEVTDVSVIFGTTGGQTQTLFVPSFAVSQPQAPPPPPPMINAPMQPGQPPAGGGLPKGLVGLKGTVRIVDRSARDEFIKSPSDSMQAARFSPNMADGKPKGVKANFVNPQSFLAALGLQTNDVLLSVNGKDIKSAEDAMAIYQTLQFEENLILKIERGGAAQDVQVEMR